MVVKIYTYRISILVTIVFYKCVLDFDLQPHPYSLVPWNLIQPKRVSMIQIGIHSYKYLLIYELREETRETLTKTLMQINGDLDFEL